MCVCVWFFQALCSTVAVVQFFLHIALFTWMLVEGMNLYSKLIVVFNTPRRYVTYLAIGWGKYTSYAIIISIIP